MSPADSNTRPSVSTTAMAARWRLSTMAPRVTSTRSGFTSGRVGGTRTGWECWSEEVMACLGWLLWHRQLAQAGAPVQVCRHARILRNRRRGHLESDEPRQSSALGSRLRRQLLLYGRSEHKGAGGAAGRYLQGARSPAHLSFRLAGRTYSAAQVYAGGD